MIDERFEGRKSRLIRTVQEQLPEFVNACSAAVDVVLLHQDAFAADYQDAECSLLGMAIKYAGLCGKEVRIVSDRGRQASQ